MALVHRADIMNALSDLFEREAVGNCLDFGKICDVLDNVADAQFVSKGAYEQVAWERNIAMLQLKEHGIPFGGIAPDVVKVTRCKNCVYNGVHTCPLCYIEKQALIFINHDPEFFCGCGEAKEEKRRTSFMKYRKKPVVIEAFQYDGDLKGSDGKYYVPVWAVEAFESGVMHYGSAADNTPPR